MPNPQIPADKALVIPEVSGLNQRQKFTNPNATEFDLLEGLIPQRDGILQRINGIKYLAQIPGKQIFNLHQTFDSRQNFLVQTDQGLYLYSEDELLGRAYTPALVPVTISDEETMAKAILIHTVAANVSGGTYTTALTWQTAPLSAILSQRNPDGTAASFVTSLAANVFTLAAGKYRISVRSLAARTTGTQAFARLFNVTTGLSAWSGLDNEVGDSTKLDANINTALYCGGDLTLAVPTQLRIEHYMANSSTTIGFGTPANLAAFKETYRWVEILYTSP